MQQLRDKLKGFDEREVSDAISYCEEYFDDAGVENEEQVIKDLGSPSKFVAQLKAEVILRNENIKRKADLRSLWILILGIFSLPVTLPLSISVIAIICALSIALLSIIFTIFIIIFSFSIVGISLLIHAFAHLNLGGDTFVILGGGFLLIGLSILSSCITYAFLQGLKKCCTLIFSELYRKIKGEKHHENA